MAGSWWDDTWSYSDQLQLDRALANAERRAEATTPTGRELDGRADRAHDPDRMFERVEWLECRRQARGVAA
jgi:hypothetical protein